MEEQVPFIPFLGGAGVPDDTAPENLASWVNEEDRVPLLLALSLYGVPRVSLGTYLIISNPNPRVGVWFDNETGICIVGTKGTSLKGPTTGEDLSDDKIIAGFGAAYCDLTLVQEASRIIDALMQQVESFIFVGHSLGGTAALCLTSKYPNSRGISFNGGGAATNPVLSGPGPVRMIHYHIFGDLVSTHISPDAAQIIRIRKHDDNFSVLYPHSSERILASDGSWTTATVDQEDEAFYKWGTKFKWKSLLTTFSPLTSFIFYLKKKDVAKKSPIPGSKRWYEFNKKI